MRRAGRATYCLGCLEFVGRRVRTRSKQVTAKISQAVTLSQYQLVVRLSGCDMSFNDKLFSGNRIILRKSLLCMQAGLSHVSLPDSPVGQPYRRRVFVVTDFVLTNSPNKKWAHCWQTHWYIIPQFWQEAGYSRVISTIKRKKNHISTQDCDIFYVEPRPSIHILGSFTKDSNIRYPRIIYEQSQVIYSYMLYCVNLSAAIRMCIRKYMSTVVNHAEPCRFILVIKVVAVRQDQKCSQRKVLFTLQQSMRNYNYLDYLDHSGQIGATTAHSN